MEREGIKMGRFKRKYNPKCYVCERPIMLLIDLRNAKKHSETYIRLWKRSVEQVVHFYHEGRMIYRHNRDSCNPGVPQ